MKNLPCSEFPGNRTAGKTHEGVGITPTGIRKRLKCCIYQHSGMNWVCKKTKMGESVLICGIKETGYLQKSAKCADLRLLEDSQMLNSTSLPLKSFS